MSKLVSGNYEIKFQFLAKGQYRKYEIKTRNKVGNNNNIIKINRNKELAQVSLPFKI